jgi:GT2 family glycosyltransferase
MPSINLFSETVCVTIVCLNRLDYTKRTLNAFAESAKADPTPFRLILVDNGSTDGTPAYLAQFKADNPRMDVTVVRLDEPTKSISEAFNRGWYEGRECGYFVKLDNDIIPNPGWLGRLKALIAAEPQFGQVGICVTASPNGDHGQLGKTRYFKAHRDRRGDFLWGACFMTRADVIRRVGVLHEGMPRDEDRDFSGRIVEAGYVIGYLPDGERCQHIGGADAAEGNNSVRQIKFQVGKHVSMTTPMGTIHGTRWGDMFPPKSMKLAILLPTRGRPELVSRFLQSLVDTTTPTDRQNMTLFVYCDRDDPTMERYDWRQWEKFIRVIPGYGPRMFPPEADNHLGVIAAREDADVFFAASDDLVFRTSGWYSGLAAAFSAVPDEIALFGFDDGAWGHELVTTPFITRRWKETLGYLIPTQFKCDHGDVWLTKIAQANGRLIWVPGKIEHMHWHFKKGVKDQTAIELHSHQAESDAAWSGCGASLEAETEKMRVAIAAKAVK